MSALAERARALLVLASWALLLLAARAGAGSPPPDPRTQEPLDVRQALGRWVDAVVEAPNTDTARLRVVAAVEVEASMGRPDRIVGYPLDEPLRRVDAKRARRIKELLLDPARYDSVLMRCRNDAFIGVRFTSAQGAVEFALGLNCPSAFWAFPSSGDGVSGDGVESWGGVMKGDATRELVRLLSPGSGADGTSEP